MSTYDATISVQGITVQPGGFVGGAQALDPSTNPIDIAFGYTVMLFLVADGIGDYEEDELTGTFTEGSFVITDVPFPATYGVAPGQYIDGIGVGSVAQCLPNGPQNVITAVGTSSITFTNSPPGGPIPALMTENNVPFDISAPLPLGHLAVSLSPTNIYNTMIDWGFDGTTDSGHVGNGQNISNYAGQAVGQVAITFLAIGTFDVTVDYASSDPNYADTTASSLVSVVVS